MKKHVFRIISLLMLCALLCTSLCGCDAIDELRASVGTKTDDNTVVWNGVTYKRMDALQSSKIEVGGQNYDQAVFLNDDNVPVLLMSMFCAEYHPTENGVFLCGVDYDAWSAGIKPIGSEEGYVTWYYCREDRFDDVAAQLRDGLDLTGYQYNYYDYDEGKTKTYNFTEEDIAMFENVVSPANRWQVSNYNWQWSATVHHCTQDGLIDTTKYYDIVNNNGVYYVEYATNAQGDAWNYDVIEYYRVPKEYTAEFDRLFDGAKREHTYWDDMDIDMQESVFFPIEEAQGEEA